VTVAVRIERVGEDWRQAHRPGAKLIEEHGLSMLRILIDRAIEWCGRPEQRAYQLFPAVNDAELHRGRMATGPDRSRT